jgi:hypothetical protein
MTTSRSLKVQLSCCTSLDGMIRIESSPLRLEVRMRARRCSGFFLRYVYSKVCVFWFEAQLLFVAWRNWTDARTRYAESHLFKNGINDNVANHFSRYAPEKMYVLPFHPLKYSSPSPLQRIRNQQYVLHISVHSI